MKSIESQAKDFVLILKAIENNFSVWFFFRILGYFNLFDFLKFILIEA